MAGMVADMEVATEERVGEEVDTTEEAAAAAAAAAGAPTGAAVATLAAVVTPGRTAREQPHPPQRPSNLPQDLCQRPLYARSGCGVRGCPHCMRFNKYSCCTAFRQSIRYLWRHSCPIGACLLGVCIRQAIAECMASTLIVTISMGCQLDGCSQE